MHSSCSHKFCYVPSALLSTIISLWTHPLPPATTFNWKSFSLRPSLAKNTNPDWTVDVRMIVLSLRKFCIWVRWYGCWADIEIPSFTFPTGCFEPSSLQADICNCVTVHLQKTQKVDPGNQPHQSWWEHVNKLSIPNTCGVKVKVFTELSFNVTTANETWGKRDYRFFESRIIWSF